MCMNTSGLSFVQIFVTACLPFSTILKRYKKTLDVFVIGEVILSRIWHPVLGLGLFNSGYLRW